MGRNITSRITVGVSIVVVLIVQDIALQQIYHPVPDGVRYLLRLIISFAGILAACLLFSRQSGGQLFGDIFSHGFRTTAVVAFLMALYTFICVKFIYPAPSTAEMEAAVKSIAQQGNVLPNEARQQAVQAAANRWIVYVSASIFVTLVPGLLGAATGAALTKKNH